MRAIVSRRDLRLSLPIVSFLAGWLPALALAAEPEDAEELFRTGKYVECATMSAEGKARNGWNESWARLVIKTELAVGKYPAAIQAIDDALRRFPASIQIHLLAHQAYRDAGRSEEAAAQLAAIERLVFAAPQRYANADGRVALGRFFLLRGADAKKVLDQFYDLVTKQQPEFTEGFLATADLAIQKQDYALAAETLRKAPKDAAEDPRYHYLLAIAFANDDRPQSSKSLAAALKINPNHVDSLLWKADHLIDGEQYKEAGDVLDQVTLINAVAPRAWAYRAVLAHLSSDPKSETAARTKALASWESNPEVDHIIGRKLSQKYRFAEGSAYQKKALEFDADYLPAKIQLCEDLLRLGDETEGWKLANEVFARDGYNVVAYNLITLRDRLAGFRTLKADGLLVRMEPREADLYGRRVLTLLNRARKTLAEKYGVGLQEQVVVEIFPRKKEFAVRTFGLPGAEGLLGVCFGRVVTANSPASQGENPSNWEAVLWHEYCHVVTLTKTHNKMPRWLSEGISVYEEGIENPAWRGATNPKFRAMILGEEFTPLSTLSSAFLNAKSALHMQFAYHEAALAVDYLVSKFGPTTVKSLLVDLGAGLTLNVALPLRAKMSLVQLDKDFKTFARAKAESVASNLTWEEIELPPEADSVAITEWLEKNPNSFWGIKRLGAKLVAEQKWDQAKTVLERFQSEYPEYVGPENPYVLLAQIHRKRSDKAAEHKILDELATRNGDAGPAYLRLLELDEAAGNWRAVELNANRMLAVNPLIPAPHRYLALASEKLGKRENAVTAYQAVALLDDSDLAGIHFRLATLLKESGKTTEARREVLKSLEEAPRFLDAHKLLLDLQKTNSHEH